MKITWLGHGSFRIEIGEQVLLLDPWLTGNPMLTEDAHAAAVAGAVEEDKAIRDAMARLNRRALSRRDLDRKLRERGHEAVARAAALERLTVLGGRYGAEYGAAAGTDVLSGVPMTNMVCNYQVRLRISEDQCGRSVASIRPPEP